MSFAAYYLLIAGAPVSVAGMCVLWVFAMRRRNAGFVDLGWVLALMALSSLYCICGSGFLLRRTLFFLMVYGWGFRLARHLVVRLSEEKEEDRRYQKIRRDFGADPERKFLAFFAFQGIVAAILSWPFLVASFDATPLIRPNEWCGLALWLAAVVGESLADHQLKIFKKDPSNQGKVCETGLWSASRHPNYFFEWLVWVSYLIFTFRSPGGLFSLVPAMLMLYFLVGVSGVPPAEAQSLASRGDAYRHYQKTTSIFIPWFKKK